MVHRGSRWVCDAYTSSTESYFFVFNKRAETFREFTKKEGSQHTRTHLGHIRLFLTYVCRVQGTFL